MVRALADAPPSSEELITTIRQNLGSWSGEAKAPVSVLPHDGVSRSVAYSPDGSHLLTGSEDRTAKLWRADTGELVGRPMSHGGHVLGVSFSPDGQRVLTGSSDGVARLWSAVSGEPVDPCWKRRIALYKVMRLPIDNRLAIHGCFIVVRVATSQPNACFLESPFRMVLNSSKVTHAIQSGNRS
jgi:WD40 repeat protein